MTRTVLPAKSTAGAAGFCASPAGLAASAGFVAASAGFAAVGAAGALVGAAALGAGAEGLLQAVTARMAANAITHWRTFCHRISTRRVMEHSSQLRLSLRSKPRLGCGPGVPFAASVVGAPDK